MLPRRLPHILSHPVQAFSFGTIDRFGPENIPDGAASASKNWLTKGDRLELRGGQASLLTYDASTGRTSGLHIGYRLNGTMVYFWSQGKKVYCYDPVTKVQTEIGTDILGTAASGEDVMFANYVSTAGAQTWFGSPHSGLFKVMTANPSSYSSMYDGSGTPPVNYKGWIGIYKNRMRLWGVSTSPADAYISKIDGQSYTTVSSENLASGDGSTKTFAGTLAFRAGNPTRTCFNVAITDSTETFTDDGSGNLTGSLGGSGTINYTTGAYSVTFNTAPVVGVNNITGSYQWENSNSGGISDFRYSGTRVAGEGAVFPQRTDGDPIKAILDLGETMYCFHERHTWALTLTDTDTNATNLPFRTLMGIPYLRAAVATPQGIFFLDHADKDKPFLRLLRPNSLNSNVTPETLSEGVKLENFDFSQCAMMAWDDYVLFSCKKAGSSANDRLWTYNKVLKNHPLDLLDYYVSCMASGDGTLLAGESLSNNIETLFSGYDDDDASIDNSWEGNLSGISFGGRMKRVRRFRVRGLIQINQGFDIYYQTDRSGYVKIGSISGNGYYVDKGNSVLVGTYTTGSKVVGAGSDGIEAHPYEHEIRIGMDHFDLRQVKFVATGIGYVSINLHEDRDIRPGVTKIAKKYRLTS